jgi:hypothetical protein
VEFSDVPTDKEIETAKKIYELTKDMDGMDENLILTPSKGRKRGGEAEPGNNEKKIKTEKSHQEKTVKSEKGVKIDSEVGPDEAEGDESRNGAVKQELKEELALHAREEERKRAYSKDEEEAEF